MTYVEGLVAPVLAGRREDYLAMARRIGDLFVEHGALQVVETYGDVDLPEGKRTDMWRAVAADKAGGEGIVFSWMIWPSKAARDAGWEKAMADPRMAPEPDMPFDPKRMIFGGFDLLYDSNAEAAAHPPEGE
jgi:uncharacterized protein YbaA (DUF1428 family)